MWPTITWKTYVVQKNLKQPGSRGICCLAGNDVFALHRNGEGQFGRNRLGDSLQLVIGDGHIRLDDGQGIAAAVIRGSHNVFDVDAGQGKRLTNGRNHAGAVCIAQDDGVAGQGGIQVVELGNAGDNRVAIHHDAAHAADNLLTIHLHVDINGQGIIIELISYATINMIPMGMPLAMLFAAIMTLGNLGENYELLAMKSAGMSLMQILKPLIILVVFMSIGSFFVVNNLVPYANKKMTSIIIDIRRQKKVLEFQDGLFFNGIDENLSIRVEHQDPETGLPYRLDDPQR